MLKVMKTRFNIVLAAAAVMAAQGCDNALNPVLDNAFYISEASSSNMEKVILNETDGASVSATVRCGALLDSDVTVRLELSQAALDEYNRRNGTSLQMLPETSHDFKACDVTVSAGHSTADRVLVHVAPYTEEMKESGIKYALPISITSISDDIPALAVKKTMIYTFEQVIITGGFQINQMSSAWCVLKDKLATNTYTLEMRVAPRGLNKENEAFFMVYPDEEVAQEGKGQIYCRFQKDNTVNIQVLANENYTWEGPVTNKWYHIAIVCAGDGNLITYVNGAEVMRENKPVYTNLNHLEKVYFGSDSRTWHTYSYCYSEVRLWSCARTKSQIADNMYAVSPKSDGLEAYWKCNEGEGTVLHDATGHGNDIDLVANVSTQLADASDAWEWVGPVRSDTDKLLDAE